MTGRAATEFSWRELVTSMRVWIRQNAGRAVLMAVIGFLVGWVLNTYIIAVRYEGSNAGTGVGSTGGFAQVLRYGALFWGILATIVFSLVAYGRQVGWRRLGREIASIPRILRDTFVTGGTTAWAVLLWGAAISLAAAVLIGPAVAGILSVGLLLAAPSPISGILGKFLNRLLMSLIRLLSPAKQTDIPNLGGTVATVAGTAAGMLLAWQVVSGPVKIALAVVSGVVAFLLVTGRLTPSAAAGLLVLFTGLLVFRDLFDAHVVLADDGGWQECGDCSIVDWVQSEGANDVIAASARGGLAAGVGAAVGTGLGSAVAGGAAPAGPGPEGEPPPPSDDLPPGDEDEGDEDERPDRYRERPGPAVVTLIDPATGKTLPVDADGNVKYGDGWLTPEQAAERIAIDQGWLDARAAGQKLIDEFKKTRAEHATETDPARRAELDQRLNELTNQINQSYSAKNVLKGEGRTAVGEDYDGRLSEIYERIDQDFIDRLNEMGFQRGGRPWTLDDITEFRNAASKGTVGMDRDIGLNENKLRELTTKLNELPPGSPEAKAVAKELADEINRTKLTVDYDKYTEHLSNEIARTNAELERLGSALAEATPGSAEAQRLQGELDRLASRPGDLEAELSRVQTEAGGRGVVEISPSRWNDTAVSTYGRSFSDRTGGDPEGAYQAVTQRHHQEAYGDKGVLSGEPDRFDPRMAEQTASVSRVKLAENQHLADEGKITQGEAIQETARGYAKDIATKVVPHMTNNANIDPAKADMIRRIGEVLDRVGKGEIPPGQVDQALARAVPEVKGIDLDRATRIVDSNFEASVKAGRAPVAEGERVPGAGEPARSATGEPERAEAGGSRIGTAFARTTDAATIDHYTRQHIAAGKDPAEAAALATAQTAAGNAAIASGIADPRTSMAGGALLPGGMNNILPDVAVENFVGTAYDAGAAGIESLSDSIAAGQLDTQAFDDFAEGVTQREGIDPFKGIGEASQVLGEEWARSDGGSLVSDMQRIIETGAGADVANESMADFQAGVAAGQHGVALEGLDHVARIAGETVADPSGTVGQLVNDIQNIATHGVGDGYWEESWDHTRQVIEQTPLIGTVVGGYNEIATGLGEQGVTGFAEEMFEGGAALAGEAYEAAGNAVGSVFGYVKSMW